MFLKKYSGILFLVGSVIGQQSYSGYEDYQDYQDYADTYQPEQDNIYQDYAQRQEDKGAANNGGAGGAGLGKLLILSTATWFVGGKLHSRGATRKLKTQFQREQKALYSQYYNDVYKLTEQNNQLLFTIETLEKSLKSTKEKAELDAIQRDYDEFKQPDIDGDDRISRAEFNMYVKNYLSNYPGLQEKDYPQFDDFDHDGDGYVSFQEYAQQMALQVQKAEKEAHKAQQSGSGEASKKRAQAIQGLYQETKKTTTNKKKKDSFQDIYSAYS